MRLLCTGDLHIGRFPSHVPLSDRSLSVESAWDRAVALALDEQVDAVVLTGDVADQDNKFFEALGPLRAGVERLWKGGIRTVAVTGNHDFDVLRRLAGQVDPDAFTLLGENGTWSSTLLERDGQPALRLVGWSFPTQHVRTSPLATFPALEPGPPTLGVVHGDLGNDASPYAPLRRADLESAPVTGWLLGHIHKPMHQLAADGFILYPGSLQPLDPGEAGPHGPWIVALQQDGTVTATQHPLANLRYDRVLVDLTGVSRLEDAEAALAAAVDGYLQARATDHPALRRAVIDVHLQGRTALFSMLPDLAESVSDQPLPGAVAQAVVRRVRIEAAPHHDLAQLAQRNDPAGVAAGLLLALQADDGPARDLVDQAVAGIQSVDRAPAFVPLRGYAPDADELRETARSGLVEQGYRLLDGLMAQISTD